jgi:DNA-directed RNA polymerase subunit RPC12/RpoP
MTRVTDFHMVNEAGDRVLCDAFGNNVAFNCPKCGHPMLAIILPEQNKPGSTPNNAAICRHCDFRVWVVAEPAKKLLRLQSSD